MIKDFKLPNGRLEARNGKIIQHWSRDYTKDSTITGNGQLNPESLKDWLDEATKPRYELVQPDRELWSVLDNKINVILASFNITEDFDAKAEAEKLCKQLNEGEGG